MDRITQDVEDELGQTPAWAQGTNEEIVARRAADAKPLYDAAYQHGAVDDPKVRAVLDRMFGKRARATGPESRKAWETAKAFAFEETGQELPEIITKASPPRGADPVRWRKRVDELIAQGVDEVQAARLQGGVIEKAEIPTVQAIDYLKRGIDRVLETEGQGMGKLKRGMLRDLKNELLAATDEVVKPYGAARAQFAGDSRELEAIEEAVKAVRGEDARGFRAALQKAEGRGTDKVFRGVAQDELLRPGRRSQRQFGTGTPDVLNAITKGERADMLLDLAGGNASDLEHKLRWEQKFNKTYNESLGNSKTAKRLQGALGEVGAGMDYGIASVLSGNIPLAARAGGASGLKWLTKLAETKNDRALFELLSAGQPGKISIEDAIAAKNMAKAILAKQNVKNDRVTGVLAGSLGAKLGSPR